MPQPGAVDDRRDLVERHAEDVVEHEGEPLGRLERVEHDEKREADRIGEHRFGLGFPLTASDDRIGQTHVQRILASRRPRSQHVEAHTRNDGRQPASKARDVAHIGPAQPYPGFLDGILRFARRSEHAIRHRAQMRPVSFELIGEPLTCRHQSPCPVGVPVVMTDRTSEM